MDFYFCLYGQFSTTTGLFAYNYTTCNFLQSLLTIWMHISCSYDMSYVITYDIWKSELWAKLTIIVIISRPSILVEEIHPNFGYEIWTAIEFVLSRILLGLRVLLIRLGGLGGLGRVQFDLPSDLERSDVWHNRCKNRFFLGWRLGLVRNRGDGRNGLFCDRAVIGQW